MHILPIIAIIMSFPSLCVCTVVRPFGSIVVRRPEDTATPFPLIWLGAPEEAQHMLTDTPATLLTAWLGEPDQPEPSGATTGKRSLEEEAVGYLTPEIQKLRRCRPDECPGAPLRVVPCSQPNNIVRRLW